MSLNLRLVAALAAAILVLVVGAVGYDAIAQARAAALAVNRTNQTRNELERTLRAVVDAETGQRGYLLTGDSSYLAPYHAARPEVDHEIALLRAGLEDSVQIQRVDTLALLADARLVDLNEIIMLREQGNTAGAGALLVSGRGERLTRAIRQLVQRMEAHERTALARRTAQYSNRTTRAALVIVLGTITAAALSMLSLFAIRTAIVELHRANAAADAALQRVEQLLESTDEGIYGVDRSGTCTFINSAGARLLGYDRAELLGKPMHETIHTRPGTTPSPSDCAIMATVRDGRTVRETNETFWRKDGSALPVECIASPVFQGRGVVGAVVVFDDITERKRAEHERERLITALARSNAELDQFAYVASHDLKAPLRGIAHLSEWIEEDLGGDVPPDVREKMNLLRGRVRRLESLIDGILQYSRAGRVRAPEESVDTGALVHEVIDLLAPPPEITIRVAPDMPTLVTERTPLQQVFMNLIGNAIKYNRRPGATIDVTARDTGAFWAFSVADNGPGIAPEYHERIFGIFQTLESRDRVEGTGIGLAVVKKTVELRGGKITVQSEPGRGAVFTFEWPERPREQTTV